MKSVLKPQGKTGTRRLLNDRGVVAIEYALLMPVLLMLILGLIDAGRVVWTQATLDHAAENAARCGAIDTVQCGTVDAIKAYAIKRAPGLALQSSVFEVAVTACGQSVTASLVLGLILPWSGRNSVTLNAAACYPL